MPSIDIEFKPSKIAILLILWIWFGAMIAVISLHKASWITLALLLTISVYGMRALFLHGLLLDPKAIRGLKHVSGEHWQLFLRQGEYMASLQGDSTVTLMFCVLRFHIPDHKFTYSCILFNDSFEFDMYRRLLLRLRCFKSW